MAATSGAFCVSEADSIRCAAGLFGHLHLVCAINGSGDNYLRQQSFQAPMHLSKPFDAGGTLVANVVNVTAGLLAGDRVHIGVKVESGARLLLTTPSASRVHRMKEGHAAVEQEFTVASGAWLEIWPELFIPHRGARYSQKSAVRVAPGGELLFFETLAPGRVASGEAFAYDQLDWSTDIFLGSQTIARERYSLAPAQGGLDALRTRFPAAYYASCFIVTERLTDGSSCWSQIHSFQEKDVWTGCSRLVGGGWTVKILAGSSVAFRQTLLAIRRVLFSALGLEMPLLRRAGEE